MRAFDSSGFRNVLGCGDHTTLEPVACVGVCAWWGKAGVTLSLFLFQVATAHLAWASVAIHQVQVRTGAAFTGRPREGRCAARLQQAEGGLAATPGLLCA